MTAALWALIAKLGIEIDPELSALAFIHRSYSYENGGIPTNERLEFLGDSVLGVIVTEHLYRTFPELPEGNLARLRAAVVSTRALAAAARDLEVGPLIRLGRGEMTTGGSDKDSILADTMESIIGAIFLSQGMEAASRFVHAVVDPRVAVAATKGAGLDWKTSLQEVAADQGWPMPTYEVEQSGPDHDRRFTAWCVVNGERRGSGTGRNKKAAEQIAAGETFKVLQVELAAEDSAAKSAVIEPGEG